MVQGETRQVQDDVDFLTEKAILDLPNRFFPAWREQDHQGELARRLNVSKAFFTASERQSQLHHQDNGLSARILDCDLKVDLLAARLPSISPAYEAGRITDQQGKDTPEVFGR
jgi:hypothetical protein